MTEYSKLDQTLRVPGIAKWYYGAGDPLRMGVRADHFHVVPLGFPRLAILQEGRYWQGGSTTSVGVHLELEDL